MAIRFKFRSSAAFDSVRIGDDRPSISVGDLKTRIRRLKNLDTSSGSDLRVSNAVTGEEYRNDNVQIPSGSSVIIKRVPAGPSSPLAIDSNDIIEKFGIKDINPGVISSLADKDRTLRKPSHSVKEDVIDFDDFGDDVCPVLESMIDNSSFNVKKKCSSSSEKLKAGTARCNQPIAESGCRLDDSGHNEAISRGPMVVGIESEKLPVEAKTETEGSLKLPKAINASLIATQNVDLPAELKCSLCNALYDKAVMILCCQNSYCERCIHPVLNEKSRCPNCYATCRTEDVLPNVSLRHAVGIFIRSQVFADGADDIHRHASDGESGIQGKEASGDLTIVNWGSEYYQPSKVAKKGLGLIVLESSLDRNSRNKAVTAGSCPHVDLTERARQICEAEEEEEEEVDSSCSVDIKSGNMVVFPGCNVKSESMPEQAGSAVKRGNKLIDPTGGHVGLLKTGAYRKGRRACYMCGSLNHLIRNCPHASAQHPMAWRGSAFFPDSIPSFGNATPLLPVRPFPGQSVNFGMMPLNTAMIPAAPLSAPMYMSTMYGGLPSYGGFTRLGSMAPMVGVGTGLEHSFEELNDLHNHEKQWEVAKKNMAGDTSIDFGVDDGYIKRCCLADVKKCQKEDILSYSDNSLSQKPQREHQRGRNLDTDIRLIEGRHEKTSHSSISPRDGRLYRREGITSTEAEYGPSWSSWQAKERHYYRDGETKTYKENLSQFSSDSSWSHCQADKRIDVKRKRDESNFKRHDRKPCSLELDCARKSPSDKENRTRDKNSSHRPRESRHIRCPRHDGRSMNDVLFHDGWTMVSGSDKDNPGRPRHDKRNKVC